MIEPFETTGIGSLPLKDPFRAVELILSSCDIPFWPQLPPRSFRELMIPQYTEGLPGVEIDTEKDRVFIKYCGPEELNRFYSLYSEGHLFPLSEAYASGFYAFLRSISNRNLPYIKGQITGPLTFTLGLRAPDGRYLYFDEELREVAALLLQRKAEWQIKRLSEYAGRVIIFIDEPILTAIGGSSYMGVEASDIERLLSNTVNAIKAAGGISGIHCCGKADWGMLTRTGVEVLNFDAYEYFDTLRIYAVEIGEFLKRGGYLAWGIVPTTDAIDKEELEGLKERLDSELQSLSETVSNDLLKKNIILTPSCGAGSRTVEQAEKILSLLKSLGKEMRR